MSTDTSGALGCGRGILNTAALSRTPPLLPLSLLLARQSAQAELQNSLARGALSVLPGASSTLLGVFTGGGQAQARQRTTEGPRSDRSVASTRSRGQPSRMTGGFDETPEVNPFLSDSSTPQPSAPQEDARGEVNPFRDDDVVV